MNIFQQSIARTRAKMHEANRLARVMVRRIKADRAHANTNLELLLDQIVAETGIELKPENMPTIMTYVTQFIESQQQQAGHDGDGMRDYPL